MVGVTINSTSAALNCYVTGAFYGCAFLAAVLSLKRKYAMRREITHGSHNSSYQKLEPFQFEMEDHMIEGGSEKAVIETST